MVNSAQRASLNVSRAWLVALGGCLSLALSCVCGSARAQEIDPADLAPAALAKPDAPETEEKAEPPEKVEKLGNASETLTGQLKSDLRPEDAVRSSAELVER